MIYTYTSTVSDGTMKLDPSANPEAVHANREKFLRAHDISPPATTLVHLTYGGENYRRYQLVSDEMKGDGMTRVSSIEVDALVVREKNHALFLPLADCIGAILYDPINELMMLSHLGRHNLEQNGGFESVSYLVSEYGSDPTKLDVWLSPAAGSDSYPLFSFSNRSMHDVAREQLESAGVLPDKIEVSDIDVTKDEHYFSHSQFLKGNRPSDGRFAVVCVLR